jgi:hypothetical protein
MPVERSRKTTTIRPGELIASYRCRPLRWTEGLALLLLSGMAVGGPLLYGYYRAQYAFAYYGPVAASMWSRPWFFLAGFALVVSLILLIYRLVESRRHVNVHANGLLLALSRKQFVPWGSLSGVASGAVQARFFRIPLGTQYQATLYPSVGKPVSLESTLEHLPELLTQIKARLYPHLLPHLMQAFMEGKRIYFGKIGIDQNGLQIKNGNPTRHVLGWKQINRLQVDSGMLVIQPENGTVIRMPILEIPNLELLLQIIQTGVNP